MKPKNNARSLVAAVIVVGTLWGASGAVAACTPKREAAAADLATKDTLCMTSELNRTPEQALVDCVIPKDSKSVQDLIDLIVGAQVSAVKAGASLPKATNITVDGGAIMVDGGATGARVLR